MASALGALFDGGIAHFLALFEMAGTLFTLIFVCGHGGLSLTILVNWRMIDSAIEIVGNNLRARIGIDSGHFLGR